MRLEIKSIHDRVGITSISVTHDDAGNGPGWFLSSIAVKKGAQALKTLSFNQWVYTGTTVTRS